LVDRRRHSGLPRFTLTLRGCVLFGGQYNRGRLRLWFLRPQQARRIRAESRNQTAEGNELVISFEKHTLGFISPGLRVGDLGVKGVDVVGTVDKAKLKVLDGLLLEVDLGFSRG
jgi:hypothetical protein